MCIRDRGISVNDALFIRFHLLGLIEEFPGRDSYIIVRGDMVFAEENPITGPWENQALIFEVSNLSGPALVPDFVAYKLGDSSLSSSACDE